MKTSLGDKYKEKRTCSFIEHLVKLKAYLLEDATWEREKEFHKTFPDLIYRY
jgi:hypothetical protein